MKTVAIMAAILSPFVAAAIGSGVAVATQPCPTEDSTNCYWDAAARGNGDGRSFVVFRLFDGGADHIIYLD